MINKMKQKLKNNLIQDIVTVGFIDKENEIVEYYPDLTQIYLEFNNCIMEFESIEQYSKLKISFVDKVELKLEIDDEMIVARSSIINTILVGGEYTESKDIKKISFINIIEKDNYIICDALKIVLSNDEILFFDPTFLHGISIGGIEKELCWEDNYIGQHSCKEMYILEL